MPVPDVADMVMELMRRGNRGGLPMQASPELNQYLQQAHGAVGQPPPPNNLMQGPGSGYADIRSSEFLSPEGPSQSPASRSPSPMEMVGENFTDTPLYIWYNRNGKRIRLDGPFNSDIEAMRELRELRRSGLAADAEVEIAPDFDPR